MVVGAVLGGWELLAAGGGGCSAGALLVGGEGTGTDTRLLSQADSKTSNNTKLACKRGKRGIGSPTSLVQKSRVRNQLLLK